jgi:hypothetical protein
MQSGEQLDTLVMTIVVEQCGGNDRAGVTDDHAEWPKPSSSSSSARSATSVRPARPAPKNAGGHARFGLSAKRLRTSESATGSLPAWHLDSLVAALIESSRWPAPNLNLSAPSTNEPAGGNRRPWVAPVDGT